MIVHQQDTDCHRAGLYLNEFVGSLAAGFVTPLRESRPMIVASAVLLAQIAIDERVYELDRLAGALSVLVVLGIGVGFAALRASAPTALARLVAAFCIASVPAIALVDASNLRGFVGRTIGLPVAITSPQPVPATPVAIGIAVAALCAASLGVSARGRGRALWWLLTAMALGMTIVLSTSASWGLIAGLAVLVPLATLRRAWIASSLAVGVAGLVGCAAVALSVTDASFQQRLLLWNDTIARIDEHPIAGLGFGTFPFITPFIGITNAHNVALQAWSDFGLPGSAALLGVALHTLVRASRAAADGSTGERTWGRAAFACVVAFFVIGGAESTIDMTFAVGYGFVTVMSPFLFIAAGLAPPRSAAGATFGAHST